MPSVQSVETALSLIKTDESKVLGLTIGGKQVTPGQHIPKGDATAAPEISFPSTTGTYIIACLDVDAPFPSFPVLSPALHWIQSDLKATDGSPGVLASSAPEICFYAGPGPPPPSAPHRYVFLLYEQPADFNVKKHAPAEGKKFPMTKRIRYDWGTFEKEAKLGPVIAANYFKSS